MARDPQRPNQPEPPAFLLHSAFSEQAKRTPDSIALHFENERITFAELESRSSQLASRLRAQGLQSGSYIGLHLERSIDYVVGILAILKTDAAAVPLPPSYPAQRLREILTFADLDAIIDVEETPVDPELVRRVVRLTEKSDDAGPEIAPLPHPDFTDNPPAFVLCSSGSTDTPKMIVRSHRSFLHRLHWTWDRHPYAAGERCVQKAFMTTTHAIYELFEPLLQGVPVRIISDQQVRDLEGFWATLRAEKVSRLLIVPSMLQASLDLPDFVAPALKSLVLMGEHVPIPLAQRAIAAFPSTTPIFSIYGSTEASSTLVCDVRASFRPGEELPLGAPISPEVRIQVLDPDAQPVAPGHAGMLYIAGPPLFTEYFKDPVRTRATFDLPGDESRTWYRTSDQVRVLPNGDLSFVGRTDHTVKIRGFRVDLAEVERAISLHPGVRQSVVMPSEAGTLMAFVTPTTVPIPEVLELLRSRLPAYMVPSTFVALEAFPRTASAKVDRRRLLEEYERTASTRASNEYRSATERRVAEVWKSVLHQGAIERQSSFFETGGTSLTVFAVAHRLREAFALDRSHLSDLSIYRYPTVEALAAHIDDLLAGAAPATAPADAILVTLKRGDAARPPLFVVSSAGGTLGAYEKVIGALRSPREIIGIRDPFLWGDRDLTEGFQHWVGRYTAAIRSRQARGPYHLLAYSSAGAFGYEIARQLRRDGEEVALLALIDPLALDAASPTRFGYWALRARFMRRSLERAVRLGGWLRRAVPRWLRNGRSTEANDWTLTGGEVVELTAGTRANRDHIQRISALLELNTDLPFALTDSELAAAAPDGYLRALLERVTQVAPEIDPEMIERLVVQYELQVRSQHRYQLQRYDGTVVLFDPEGPYQGLLATQLRPYVKELLVRPVKLGTLSSRGQALAASFPTPIQSHYLSMRNDVFVTHLAKELDSLLS